MANKKLSQNQQLDYLIEELEENIFQATQNQYLLIDLHSHCGKDKEMYSYFLRAAWLTIQNIQTT